MALARMAVMLVLLVALSGLGPVSGCARGGSSACRGGSTVARSGTRNMDDLARSLSRTGPTRYGHGARPIVVPGHVGGELGERAVLASLDDAVAALPPVEGPVSALARVPAGNGKVMIAESGARSFADDYARSIDAAGVTRRQHELLLDAFDAAQSAADLVGAGAAEEEPAVRELTERARIVRLSRELDARMREVLEPEQLRQLSAALGTPRVIAYRLARERPMQPAAP